MTRTIKRKRQTLETIPENYSHIHTKQKLNTVDVEINTDKQLKDYKIFVFDLDNTLYLHNGNKIYTDEYHKKVKNFLVYLKDNDKKLYIATHNFNPIKYLDKLNITELFDGIIKETKNVHPSLNTIMEYTSKKYMMLEILNNHTDLTKDDIIFFDDHNYNIKEVESINVKSIYVNQLKGINFSEIY